MVTTRKVLQRAPTHIPEAAAGEKKLPCPVCGALVKVGGPMNQWWTVQIHSPNGDVTTRCAGVGEKLPVSPR